MGNYGGKTFNWPRRGALLTRQIHVNLEDWRDGATPPTESSSGTSPAVRGLLFTSTAMSITVSFRIPLDYAGGPLDFRLWCINTGIETNGDDIDWTLDYATFLPQSKLLDGVLYANNATGKTNSQVTSVTEVFGGLAPPAGNAWECRLTVPEFNANNPLRAGRYPLLFAGELYRGSVGGAGKVGDVLLSDVTVLYTAKSDARIE